MREIRKFACSVFILAILSVNVCVVFAENENSIWGPLYKAIPLLPQNDFSAKEDVLHRWNRIAVDASGLDHTPVRRGENRVFGEQIGPGRASVQWQSFILPSLVRSILLLGVTKATLICLGVPDQSQLQ